MEKKPNTTSATSAKRKRSRDLPKHLSESPAEPESFPVDQTRHAKRNKVQSCISDTSCSVEGIKKNQSIPHVFFLRDILNFQPSTSETFEATSSRGGGQKKASIDAHASLNHRYEESPLQQTPLRVNSTRKRCQPYNAQHCQISQTGNPHNCTDFLNPTCIRKSRRWRGLDNITTTVKTPRKRKRSIHTPQLPDNFNANKENDNVCNTDVLHPTCLRLSRRWRGLENITATAKNPRKRNNSIQSPLLPHASHGNRQNVHVSNTAHVIPEPPNYKDINFNLEYQQDFEFHNASDSENERDLELMLELPANDISDRDAPRILPKKKKKTKKKKMTSSSYKDEGDPIHECSYCGALMWYGERVKKDDKKRNASTFSMCCLKGKVVLPASTPPPPVLKELFTNKISKRSKNFLENIRQYNNMFSFTSMGGKVNHALNSGSAPYVFSLSGINYHSIGDLLPPQGAKPVFSQLYIYDTENEIQNRISAVSQRQEHHKIDPDIVQSIKTVLDESNAYVSQFRVAANILSDTNSQPLKLVLLGSRETDGRTYNLPSCSEVAALVVGDIDYDFSVRDIIIHAKDGSVQHINELHPSYLPLQYPLLFPYGEDGYRDDIKHREETLATTKIKTRVSIREYLAYKLMYRPSQFSTLHHSSKLLQQFIVDVYTMMEAQRLLWVKTHQRDLRADLYKGLSDAAINGQTEASSTGKRVVLPSSFTGGARYMMGNYLDAMAICRTLGYPDLFITFTCNSSWPEIARYCASLNISSNDCPHVISRIFYIKLAALMKTLRAEKIFGKVKADIYTIEFQKRGLPHAHILLFLDKKDKPSEAASVDSIICAEIPDKNEEPDLYDLVQSLMIHGPCGEAKPKAPCMQNKTCSKYFPKPFVDQTMIDEDGYPTYRRRNDGRTVQVNKVTLDNRYVVPYNSTLLGMFQAHINVEKCNQSRAIKYLFKYINKGNDRVVAGLLQDSKVDETVQYLNCRYICACEASWRTFGFPIHHRYPSVERLSFHLPNRQYVIYDAHRDISDIVNNPRICESQFLAWMEINACSDLAKTLTYSEFPNKFVYDKKTRTWHERKQGFSVGRMASVSPSSGELYYLRILLTKVRGPTSFEDIRTVAGVVHETFKEACFARGLLQDDREYIAALKEASVWSSGNNLRKLFVTMLLCASIKQPEVVWANTSKLLSEDMFYIPRANHQAADISYPETAKQNACLKEIDRLLRFNGKSLHDFSSLPIPEDIEIMNGMNHLIVQELNYNRQALKEQSETLLSKLNAEQMIAYKAIMEAVSKKLGGFFFVYGYGGTGKTFLWNALASTIRSQGNIVLTVASSGIAANLLPRGRTAHSRFMIPISVNEFSVCNISQNSPLAELIKVTSLIIWDEAPMMQRFCYEAFNRTLQDVMQCQQIFGGKCVVMGGDFRQILPVIPKGSRADIVDASISSSRLWNFVKIFTLQQNMRLQQATDPIENLQVQQFSQWLLDVGDGKLGNDINGVSDIPIPPNILLPHSNDPISTVVTSTYDHFFESINISSYFMDRAILAPTIQMVNEINQYMCVLLPGEEFEFLSCDSICQSTDDPDTAENLYSTEFLNTITCSGLPPHRLLLKVGAPIMLLRNIDQQSGLCNGTRLQVSKIGKNVIEAKILTGSSAADSVLITRMDMNPSETRWPFKMQRRQFPIVMSFAMTINKSQGQSLKKVGIYLEKPVFTHGQLYVALSRVKSMQGLKIVLPDQDQDQEQTTQNVVYKEIFMNL